ncbi:MAG: GNAT family N-acetyltransferase [Siphonobacter sp.]
MNLSKISLTNNQHLNQFEMEIEDQIALIAYHTIHSDTLALDHTEVPEQLQGKGIASALVEKTFHYLEEHNMKMLPYCPFIRTYLQRHPDWYRLVA